MQQQQHQREPDYVRYNQLKRAWLEENKTPTDKQFNAAMREFARMCGV